MSDNLAKGERGEAGSGRGQGGRKGEEWGRNGGVWPTRKRKAPQG